MPTLYGAADWFRNYFTRSAGVRLSAAESNFFQNQYPLLIKPELKMAIEARNINLSIPYL